MGWPLTKRLAVQRGWNGSVLEFSECLFGSLQPTSRWLHFHDVHSLCFLQGERGLPGPSGPQGIQGCPGIRGLKVGLGTAPSLSMQMILSCCN